MRFEADTPQAYIDQLPEDRKRVISNLRDSILTNLPTGFVETISYGMLGYVVPHSIYPAGYHCNPKLPLPFMSVASQKNFVAVYHMGLYADQELLQWYMAEYPKYSTTKPDVGKSCLRFKKPDAIPYELIGALAGKMTVKEWVTKYEKELKK
ncbi:DUF1801 domain-containing protein [Telluribacter sp.]|jgi:hypothetical protein|uniref:DUF1801 domain-containing protein n=1 Tax=Telluribacter sp. TaxID=1978767 RepID=UPI002E100992|nr:DUF1801 domain-containing protein [Telluribacter sp.]